MSLNTLILEHFYSIFPFNHYNIQDFLFIGVVKIFLHFSFYLIVCIHISFSTNSDHHFFTLLSSLIISTILFYFWTSNLSNVLCARNLFFIILHIRIDPKHFTKDVLYSTPLLHPNCNSFNTGNEIISSATSEDASQNIYSIRWIV